MEIYYIAIVSLTCEHEILSEQFNKPIIMTVQDIGFCGYSNNINNFKELVLLEINQTFQKPNNINIKIFDYDEYISKNDISFLGEITYI